jgi:hypothetical protein
VIVSGSGPRSSRRSRVGASRGESWRFAPARTRPSGIGVPVDQQGSFHALFAAVDRRRPGDLSAAWCLGDTAVDGDIMQDQAHDAVVGLQRDGPQLREYPGGDPFVTAVADRARRAGLVGDGLVGAAEPQDLHELAEHDLIVDAAAVTSQRVRRIEHGAIGQQRRELVPQRVDEP